MNKHRYITLHTKGPKTVINPTSFSHQRIISISQIVAFSQNHFFSKKCIRHITISSSPMIFSGNIPIRPLYMENSSSQHSLFQPYQIFLQNQFPPHYFFLRKKLALHSFRKSPQPVTSFFQKKSGPSFFSTQKVSTHPDLFLGAILCLVNFALSSAIHQKKWITIITLLWLGFSRLKG